MSKLEARHLLAQARKYKGELPKTLFIAAGCPAQHLEREAEHRKVAIARVPEDQLVPFIREAREHSASTLAEGASSEPNSSFNAAAPKCRWRAVWARGLT